MALELRAGFADRLGAICEEKGLPVFGRQAVLARLCGIRPSSVNKWFNAVGLPDAPNLLRIADWADVGVEWLLTGRGPKRSGANFELVWVSAEEQELLSMFRQCDRSHQLRALTLLENGERPRGLSTTSFSVDTYPAK